MLYTYQCDSCLYSSALYFGMLEKKPKTVECPKCGKDRTRRFSAPQINTFKPVVTNCTGQEAYIGSRRELRAFEEANGVKMVTADEVTPYKRKEIERPKESIEEAFYRKKASMNEDDIRKIFKEDFKVGV